MSGQRMAKFPQIVTSIWCLSALIGTTVCVTIGYTYVGYGEISVNRHLDFVYVGCIGMVGGNSVIDD